MPAKTPSTSSVGPSAADYLQDYVETEDSGAFSPVLSTPALDTSEPREVFDSTTAERKLRMEQYNDLRAQLNRPLDREQVKQRKGFGRDTNGQTKMLSYLEHHTVTRILNTIFGPGRWSIETTQIQDYYDSTAKDGVPRAVRVTKNLTFTGVEGFNYAHIEMTGYSVNRPRPLWEGGKRVGEEYTWEGFEMALGNAEAKAFKRAAAQLGEALGLNLYSDDLEAVTEEANASAPSSPARTQQASGKPEPTTEYGDDPAYCEDCGGEIRGYTNKQTRKTYTTDDLVAMSRKYANGRILCYNCRSK